MGFLLGLAVGLFVGVLSMLSLAFRSGLPNISNLPAWLQAIGGLSAVAVAIYIPLRIKRDERIAADRKQSIRAHVAAYAIFPALLEIQARATKVEKTARDWEEAGHQKIGVIPNATGALSVAVPPALTAWLDRVHDFGFETSAAILRVAGSCDVINRSLANRADSTELAALRPLVQGICRDCEEAMKSLADLGV